jgi:signal recognition particle subunit SRP54
MFDALSDKLQAALGDLKGRGVLDDEAISRAMREVRLALLEADVNFAVVKDFVAHVRERAQGQDVQKSLTPGQQVVKIVHEELTALMGSGSSQLAFSPRPPTTILLAGLQERNDPVRAVHEGIERAKADGRDVVILDTAGRLHVDEPLMEELAAVRREAKPTNVLLVLDAMTGQEAVNVAQAFQERIDFDGVVMTKLDGDARGGAALSVKAVTGKPIKLASVGEKLDALEWFHPDRMASRILGMGDVLTLIERAEAAVGEDEKDELERRMMQGEFSFDDFLKSYKMLRRMGPLQGVLKMIPGLGKQLEGLDQVDERQLAQVEAIILSMTPHERRVPHVIDGSRRKRIAAGSGTTVQQVNQLLEGRKQMAKMMKMMGSGKMPQIPGAPNGAKPKPSATRKSSSKRKKKTKR